MGPRSQSVLERGQRPRQRFRRRPEKKKTANGGHDRTPLGQRPKGRRPWQALHRPRDEGNQIRGASTLPAFVPRHAVRALASSKDHAGGGGDIGFARGSDRFPAQRFISAADMSLSKRSMRAPLRMHKRPERSSASAPASCRESRTFAGDVLRRTRPSCEQRCGASEHVAELSHIPGPGLRRQELERPLLDQNRPARSPGRDMRSFWQSRGCPRRVAQWWQGHADWARR